MLSTRTTSFPILPAAASRPDEIPAFCYAKEANVPAEHQGESGYGDIWTLVAMDAEYQDVIISRLEESADTPTARFDFMQAMFGSELLNWYPS